MGRAVGEELSDDWNDWIVAAARAGDFDPLIGVLVDCIHCAGSLTPDMARVLIQILRGELRRPKSRPPDNSVAVRRLFISFEVEYLGRHGWQIDAAVKAAADRFAVSTRTVYEERKKFPINDSLYENIMSDRPNRTMLPRDLLLLCFRNSDDPAGRWVQHVADLIEGHRTSVCTHPMCSISPWRSGGDEEKAG